MKYIFFCTVEIMRVTHSDQRNVPKITHFGFCSDFVKKTFWINLQIDDDDQRDRNHSSERQKSSHLLVVWCDFKG